MELLTAIIFGYPFLVAAIYFLPSIIAGCKGKKNAGAIFILNLFLGWTFIGWVISLVWAAIYEQKSCRKCRQIVADVSATRCSKCGHISLRQQIKEMPITAKIFFTIAIIMLTVLIYCRLDDLSQEKDISTLYFHDSSKAKIQNVGRDKDGNE